MQEIVLEKWIEFLPAYDKRSSNCGIHGVDLTFYVKGEKGAVQFKVYTNWHLPEVQKEINDKTPSFEFPYLSHEPMAADLGYHSHVPMYDGQEPMSECCQILKGKCYYDGSGLNAIKVFDTLRKSGSKEVWKFLTEYYHETFSNVEEVKS